MAYKSLMYYLLALYYMDVMDTQVNFISLTMVFSVSCSRKIFRVCDNIFFAQKIISKQLVLLFWRTFSYFLFPVILNLLA